MAEIREKYAPPIAIVQKSKKKVKVSLNLKKPDNNAERYKDKSFIPEPNSVKELRDIKKLEKLNEKAEKEEKEPTESS